MSIFICDRVPNRMVGLIEPFPPTRSAVFIAGEQYRRHSYGVNHPLHIPRVSLTTDLIRAYDAIRDDEFIVSRIASDEELMWFHDEAYIQALKKCEQQGFVDDATRKRFQLGNFENPYFPAIFTTPATAAGGSILAAEAVLAGNISFNPPGGMHHGRPDHARGFCYINDPVLAIVRLRKANKRVMYIDIDAHHGDGVEAAFSDDGQVLCFSLHMSTQYAYPFSGGDWKDWGESGNALNMPLPKGTNDSEYRYAFRALFEPALHAFKPDALVLQAGTDLLFADPLGKFDISNRLMLEVIERILEKAPKHANGSPQLAVLGGGGYHPILLARCWAGVWGLLSGRILPDELPATAQEILRAVNWDADEDADYYPSLFESRLDSPREGTIRDEIRVTVDQLITNHPLFRARAL